MKNVRGLWAALVLAPSVFMVERAAKADLITPAASEPWVLDAVCHAEGLAKTDARCFSHRWVPESVANERLAKALARVSPSASCDGQKQQAYSPTLTPGSMGATDLITAYNLSDPSLPDGSGKIVAVVDACGYSDIVTDLNKYRAQYGIAAITECGGAAGTAPTAGGAQCIGVVSQTGTKTVPADDSNWAGETALDVQMISAACPKCSILVVQVKSASTANLNAGITEAVKLKADAVSNSWGGDESSGDTIPAHAGVLVAAASGDADYLNQIGAINEDAGTVELDPTTPNYPASDPGVLGVGGTTLTMDATSARCYSDTAWSYMIPLTSTNPLRGKTVYGGGSGCSTEFATPSYQTTLPMGSCKKRGSVDVSSAADFSPGAYSAGVCIKGQVCGGIAVYGGGGWNPSVGTSAASPFATAVLVRMALGAKTNAEIYASPTSFTDVTSGNNDPSKTCSDVMCNAGVGWDGPTGWGVPNGYTLAQFGGASPTAPTPPTCLALTDAGTGDDDDAGQSGDDDGGSGSGSSSGGSSSGGTGDDDDDSGSGSGSSSGGSSSGGSSSGGSLNDDGGPLANEEGGAGGNGNNGGSASNGCSCVVGPGTPSAPEGLGLTVFAALAVLRLRRRRSSK
jgi:MYXO-CTERM domain-containing protein